MLILKAMKKSFLICGLGSMGKRRIKLLNKIAPELEIIGLDKNKQRCESVKSLLKINCYSDIEIAIKNHPISSAFICTSPLSHKSLLKFFIEKKINTFSEINLVNDGYEDFIKVEKKLKTRHFLSSTQLYRNEINFIDQQVESSSRNWSYQYHVGQYLPDWHPWEDISDYFVSNIKTNGLREIMAIEFPWIEKVFGKFLKINSHATKHSDLKINFPDSVSIMVVHENGNHGTLLFDIISRKPTRKLLLTCDNKLIQWDGTPNGLIVHQPPDFNQKEINLYDVVDSDSKYSSTIIENPYENEIKDFLKGISDLNHSFKYSYKKDLDILNSINLIDKTI